MTSRLASPATTTTTARTSVAAPTTTAVLVAAAAHRRSITIWNNGSQTVYLGVTSAVTYLTGIPLAADISAPLVDEDTTTAWYACTQTGTGDVRALEVT